MVQHPTKTRPGERQDPIPYLVHQKDSLTVEPLPDFYALVPPVIMQNKKSAVPPAIHSVMSNKRLRNKIIFSLPALKTI